VDAPRARPAPLAPLSWFGSRLTAASHNSFPPFGEDMHNARVGAPPNGDKTLITPPYLAGPGEISYARPLASDQESLPKTLALESGAFSAPDSTTGMVVPPVRKPPSMGLVLALSALVFLFTATIGFALVWLVVS